MCVCNDDVTYIFKVSYIHLYDVYSKVQLNLKTGCGDTQLKS